MTKGQHVVARISVATSGNVFDADPDLAALIRATLISGSLAVHIGWKPALEAGLEGANRNRRLARDGDGLAAGGSDAHACHAAALHLRQHATGLSPGHRH